MPRVKLKIIILTVLVIFGILTSTDLALAQRTIELQNPLGCPDIECVLRAIANFLLIIASPILVIIVLYSGFLFLVSAGEPEKLGQAKKALLWAVIGFAIILINWGFASIIAEILGGGRRR
jgi:hypothetical protein